MAKVELKQPVVQAIAEDIKDAASVVLVDYHELSVSASQIPWSVDDGIRTMLPVMQSDIHLQKGKDRKSVV